MPQSTLPEKSSERLAYVLDDEARVGTIVCHILTSIGFTARQFSSPMPFLAEVKIAPPELIILDLALGQSDAVEVIRHLEVLKFRGKTLLMSGRDEIVLGEIEEIGQRHGLAMLPSLPKPFRAHDLKNRLTTTATIKTASRGTGNGNAVAIDLKEAFRQHWLELWYQPKIDLKSFSVCGAEALLRARHPKHGIVSPANLLPPPGDPIYQQLSRFVVAQAMADWENFAKHNLLLRLSVNIPASVVLAPDFVRVLRECLPKHKDFPGLIVEITEDEMIHDSEQIYEIATQLKLYNTRISIDDFGAAYSSLSRLRDLPCVELKLDQSFVLDCALDSSKQSLCAAAIDLGHGFGVSVCAEGVENIEDLRTLIEMRCDTAQGYLFAKPMEAKSLLDMLITRDGRPAIKNPSADFPPIDAAQLVRTA